MSQNNISDIMVETRKSNNVGTDMRTAVDIFLTVAGQDQHAVGIIVTEEDVTLAVREGGKQYLYMVQTPAEAGAATQYTITEAVTEILEVAGISTGADGQFTTSHMFDSLGIDGKDPGELDASVCDNIKELEDELQEVLDARVIDWA